MDNTKPCSSSSKKRQENGDICSESERPFKKARFSWQIKGKYHLKTRKSDDNTPSTSSNAEENSSKDIVNVINPAKTSNSLSNNEKEYKNHRSGSNDIETRHNCARYMRAHDFLMDSFGELSRFIPGFYSTYKSTTLWLNYHFKFSEDMCISRWQARQNARVLIDNTINSILERANRSRVEPAPAPAYMNNIAGDFAEFVNNLPGANSIEDKGILMAISAHGLQNSTSPNLTRQSEIDSNEFKSEKIDAEQNIEKNVGKEEINTCDDSSEYQVVDLSSKSDFGDDDMLDDSSFGESFYPYFTIDGDILMQNDNFDFIDEAVSSAIQNIGLTSSSANCG